MADLHSYKKLPSDPCLSEEKILAYIDGKLSAAEQHACEMHMADCAMCEDAVEGLSLVKDRSVLAVPVPAEPEKTEGKVVPLHRPNRKAWYAVAAVLVLVLSATFILNMMTNEDGAPTLADNTKANYDSTVLMPAQDARSIEKSIVGNEEGLKNLPGDNARSEAGDGPAEEEQYKVTITDESGAADAEEPIAPPVQAELEEEKMVFAERVVADEVADGDVEDFTVVTKPEAVANTGKDKAAKTEDVKEQSEKKNNLLEVASGIAGGTKKRAETQKQDSYMDNNRDDANVPANSNTTTVAGNTQPAAPQTAGAKFDLNDGTGATDTATVSGGFVVSDSLAVDQLELSYQNGLKQLEAGQTSNAIIMFDKVLTNKNHARYEDAEFQKAKALIKATRKEEAKTLLKSIEAKKGKHAAEATELLKTL